MLKPPTFSGFFFEKKPQVIACFSSLGWSTETWKDQRDEDENHDDDEDFSFLGTVNIIHILGWSNDIFQVGVADPLRLTKPLTVYL